MLFIVFVLSVKNHQNTINDVFHARRDGDSNPGYAFDVYTLSRRASSATRASLLLTSFYVVLTIRNLSYTNSDTKISIFFVTTAISSQKNSCFL